jgi:poly-gamma-glutamate synthesis protein (capsule biosynthesis protein)
MGTLSRRSFAEHLSVTGLVACLPLPVCFGAAATGRPLRHVTVTGQLLLKHDICADPYEGLAEVIKELGRGEVVSTDLEVAIRTASSGSPTRGSDLLHTTEASTLNCVAKLGFNLLALANNHAWDLGTQGVSATRHAVASAGFGYAGTGTDWQTATAGGRNARYPDVALVSVAIGKIRDGAAATDSRGGVNEIRMAQPGTLNAGDVARNLAAIRAASDEGQRVLVCLHNHEWEEDMQSLPDWARRFAQDCVDAGADAFFSHGAPLLKGIEIYRGKPVLHGLGSLVFQTSKAIGFYAPPVWESVIAHMTFDQGGLAGLELVPVLLNDKGDEPERHLATRGRPRIAHGTDAARILGRLQAQSEPLGTQIELRGDRGWLTPRA